MAWGQNVFGLHQIKLVNLATVPTILSLPFAQTMTCKERVKSGELSGDDKTVSVVTFADAFEWELEAGGISLEAIALMTGRIVTTDAVTPNRTSTLTAIAGQAYPYFKIYGKVLGDSIDDLHIKIYKAKLSGPVEGEFKDGEFFVTKCAGIAITNGTHIYQLVQNETATALPVT
jgi:hypothetical protein